jgi:hypothetical protein
MRLLALIALPLLIAGCAHEKPTITQATGNAIAVTGAHLESAGRHNDAVIPQTSGETRVHAESTRAELNAAKASNAEAESNFNKVAKQLAAVLASWSYKIGHFIVSWLFVIVLMAVASAVLRSLALAIPGPWGAALSVAATVLFGILTGGLGIIFTASENAYHRGRVAASPPASE